MIKRYRIVDHHIEETDSGTPDIMIVIKPNDDEKLWFIENFQLDEHTFNSAFDPEEQARIEYEPKHLAVIFKRPQNYSSQDNFLFKVSSMGLFLFKDKLIIALSEDINIFTGKYFKSIRGLRELFLKVIYASISHFMSHLKTINMVADEIETKITHSMENRYLLNMFALEKSLVYYLNAISSNGIVIERLKTNTDKTGFSQRSLEFVDDLLIENQQCYKQAEIYSNIFASLSGARASIVSNNLNILMKNLNAVVISVAIPSFFAGVGGMSEINKIIGIGNTHLAYTIFLSFMLLIATVTFFLIKRLEKH